MFKGLIVTGELGQLRYYEEVARRLKTFGCQLGFCCDRDDPGVAQAISDVAAKYHMNFYHHMETGDSIVYTPSLLRSVIDKFYKYKVFPKSKNAKRFEAHISKVKFDLFRNIHFSRLLSAKKILQDFQPDVIIIGEDGIASDFWMISTAKKLGIPVAVLPYGIADSSSLIYKGIEERHHNGELLTTADPAVALIKDLYPKWIKKTVYGNVIYFPPEYILALEALKIQIPNPWCFQGGQADILLLESDAMYQRYTDEGISKRKMQLSGSVYCDVMYDVIQEDMSLQFAFNNFQRLDEKQLHVLVCIPPSDHEGWGHKCEYSSVADFISSLLKLFNEFSHLNVTYSFHPRMKETDRQEIIALGVIDYPGFPLYAIPRCDIMISCGSSLARWALAARKLVVNFDIYHFGVNDFPHVPSYIQINEMTQLKALIHKVNQKQTWYKDILLRSKIESDKMGKINGEATLSIFNVIQKKINSH
ncbi:hypothetical protein OQJ35_04375 [Legionella pneumophila]|uniref:hypothetical protein n=1 Tax=Legionella TaxID=445 RepID=UPI000777E1E9|nr:MULTISPECIES: hypothetical protein [Legionella]MCW8420790.1 hypothetical protein [Legionella sp. PATHC032]MCW8427761.1 hypothetical protein [Legionella pneumophila]HAT6809172.1 hypothetical protein [Legionella pneumophila]HAT8670089.1 hypothetical protein [Legionella pneumophila]HAZ7574722.1 hypothetical protein [Legionella pneumophila]